MDIRQLQYLAALAREKHYTRAAQAHLDEVSRVCTACGASYFTVDTRTPMIEALAKRACQS